MTLRTRELACPLVLFGALAACGGRDVGGANAEPAGQGATAGDGGSGGGKAGAGGGGEGGAGGAFDAGMSICPPCTRREGLRTPPNCPVGRLNLGGGGAGPEGGTYRIQSHTYPTNGPRLVIPPNALSESLTITMAEIGNTPPREFVDWSPVWSIGPGGVKTTVPMTLTLPWTNHDTPMPGELSIFTSIDGGPYEELPSVDTGGVLTASVHEFGFFFVGARKTPEQIDCP